METDESLLKFPCEFPIKAKGKAENDFDALVVSLIRKHRRICSRVPLNQDIALVVALSQ